MARRKTLLDRLREQDRGNGHGKPALKPLPPERYPEDKQGDAYEGDHTLLPEPTPAQLGTLLSTVKPETVSWLWPARIPLGKVTILDGDPGLGKSVLTMDLAGRVSSGKPMVDRTPCQAAGVIILNAEDGLGDTILPRLLAAGGDPGRVLALTSVPDGTAERCISLPLDLAHVKTAIKQVEARLVIIDPIMAFLGSEVNSHRDQDIRRALHPLAKVAEETGVAVVVVRHLNKAGSNNPLYRGGGSIGIIGAARSGLLVAKDPDSPDRRVLASTKCNLAKLPSSLLFDLSQGEHGGLRVGWIGECAHTAESLLAMPKDDEEPNAVQEAVEVLRAVLAGGSVAADEAQRQARKAGVSEKTLKRAKAVLGIRSRLIGFGRDGKWTWYLPTPEEANLSREGQT